MGALWEIMCGRRKNIRCLHLWKSTCKEIQKTANCSYFHIKFLTMHFRYRIIDKKFIYFSKWSCIGLLKMLACIHRAFRCGCNNSYVIYKILVFRLQRNDWRKQTDKHSGARTETCNYLAKRQLIAYFKNGLRRYLLFTQEVSTKYQILCLRYY
jgi:hypothetical protein